MLFRIVGTRVVPIFDQTMDSDNREFSWTSTQHSEDDKTAETDKETVIESRETHSVLIIDGMRTEGINDLILKSVEKEREPDSDKVRSTAIRKKRFRWNGTQYIEAPKSVRSDQR